MKTGCVLCLGVTERDNPYDQIKQPNEYAVWQEAFRAVWLECQPDRSELVLKEEETVSRAQCEFALIWQPFWFPFRLHANDVIRFEGRLGRVLRVTESAAVVLLSRPARRFKTRFDKAVSFLPSPRLVRISANSETEVLNRKPRKQRKGGRHENLQRSA